MESVRLRDPALKVEEMNGKGKEVNADKAVPQRSPHLSSGVCDPALSSDGPELPCRMIGSSPDGRGGRGTSNRMDHRSKHGEKCSRVVPILLGPFLPAPSSVGLP